MTRDETGYLPDSRLTLFDGAANAGRKPRAVAVGLFDGVHLGHQDILKTTAALALDRGWVPTVLTFSALLAEKPGCGKAIFGPEEKQEWLSAFGIRELVTEPFSAVKDMDCGLFVKRILTDALTAGAVIVGDDFRFGRGRSGDAAVLKALMEENGSECVVLPSRVLDGEKISSSSIRSLLESGRPEEAARRMGHPASWILPIESGDRIGRSIGYPTINQRLPEERQIYRYGVYAVTAEPGDGNRYSGVCNVGVKPTVGGTVPLAETYLHGFSGDLYGKNVKISLLRFLRPENAFPGLVELKEQIAKDIIAAAEGTE
ncbi:MAG: riboflavin biosynthesis protein RibF [Clostridia bacterium]|nr:riboflavin biosynthesis protein RibF [Clostridia bacterium]